MRLIGYYNEYGYSIVNVDNGKVIYSAGNSLFDSQQSMGLDECLPLDTVKSFCQETLWDIAKSFKAKAIGVEYEEIESLS